MTPKFLRYGKPRKLQVITFSKPVWYLKARAFEADMLRAYVHVLARKELFHMVYILNWDFDVLPITFDENLLLCSLAESMNYND